MVKNSYDFVTNFFFLQILKKKKIEMKKKNNCNLRNFEEKKFLKILEMDTKSVMVNYDVSSLYINVPAKET